MRDAAARTRTGLTVGRARPSPPDTRIHVDLAHLRRLEGPARWLSLLPRQQARSVLRGRHASRLRGRGLNFEELRGYLPGDDVRSIDWKVTARTGEPHIRVYTEERDRPVMILVDQRQSMFFGSRLNMKSVTAAETAALAAFRVLHQGDRVGGVVFGDDRAAEFRPARRRGTLERLLAAIAAANATLTAEAPSRPAMPLNAPLASMLRIARRDHLILLISDFDDVDDRTDRLIGGLCRHNDVLLCPVTDPTAQDIPESLRLVVSDGVLQAEIDATSGRVRQALRDFSTGRLARVLDWERRFGAAVLPLSAGEATLPQILRLLGRARPA